MSSIKVGVAISLSGRYSIQGAESFKGLGLWVKEVNERGGIYVGALGRKCTLELIHYDDQSSSENIVTLIKRLIMDDKVDILVGPYSSTITLNAAQVAERYNKTLWNHGGATDEIGERDLSCVVSAITPTRNYGLGVIDLVRELDPSASKIAAFSAGDSGFSRNILHGVRERAAQNGFDLREFNYISGKADFNSYVEDLKDYGPDLILSMGRMEDDLGLAEVLRDRAVTAKALWFVAASIKHFKERLGSWADGVFSTSQWEEGIKIDPDMGPGPKEFADRFRSENKESPQYLGAQGYNIGIIIEKCIAEAGSLDDGLLRNISRKLDITTFYGDFRTDDNGNQIAHEMAVVQWQGPEKVIVHPRHLSNSKVNYPNN